MREGIYAFNGLELALLIIVCAIVGYVICEISRRR